MEFGISGAPVPSALRYAWQVNAGGLSYDVSPMLAYAIAFVETIHGEIISLWPSAATVEAADGGCGLFQLTPPPPGVDWQNPEENAGAACYHWIAPAIDFWAGSVAGFRGETLVRLVADEFNEGRSAAWAWHLKGNADEGTTGSDYGAKVLAVYQALVAGEPLPAI